MRRLFLLVCGATALTAEPLRVMSYNVRYPASGDGPNLWERRRDIFIESIRRQSPDLIGTQELFALQGEYLVQQLPEFAWFGISRTPGKNDEHMGVFYRKSKLRVVESGHFWLSESPDVPGSMSWNVTLPRMVTWALFETQPGRKRFYFYNTHFAHRQQDEEARVRSAEVIRARIANLPGRIPFLMTGDFNAPAGGAAQRVFLPLLTDAWTRARQKSGPEGTFHGFTGKPGNARIDWILYRGRWRVREMAAIDWNQSGRYPSDHFPVFGLLDLR